tara:strand:+ start:4174 stop:5067 length:894 start_codon:yes stop_codon:yes gene_type:complete
MASTQIRNLLNNSIDKPIVEAKNQLKKEGRKKVTSIKEKLPTPESLKEKFVTSACSPKAQAKIDRIYNKSSKRLKKFKKTLEATKQKMSSLSNKLEKIEGIIETIKKILQAIAIILIALEIIVRVAPAGLAASSGPAASGIIIDRLGKAIDYGKAKIKEYGSLTKAILSNLPKYLEKALAVIGMIALALISLNALIALIDKLIVFLEFIYGKYIENCTVADQTPINNEGLINEELILANENLAAAGIPDKMSTFYNDLLQTLSEGGFTLQAQRIFKVADESDLIQISYQLIETPKNI